MNKTTYTPLQDEWMKVDALVKRVKELEACLRLVNGSWTNDSGVAFVQPDVMRKVSAALKGSQP